MTMIRPGHQVQRAHDILAGIILGDAPSPWGDPVPPEIIAAEDVLCWVLQHDHNRTFGENLAKAHCWLVSQGYALKDNQP